MLLSLEQLITFFQLLKLLEQGLFLWIVKGQAKYLRAQLLRSRLMEKEQFTELHK
jgi:hypothetical protein